MMHLPRDFSGKIEGGSVRGDRTGKLRYACPMARRSESRPQSLRSIWSAELGTTFKKDRVAPGTRMPTEPTGAY